MSLRYLDGGYGLQMGRTFFYFFVCVGGVQVFVGGFGADMCVWECRYMGV